MSDGKAMGNRREAIAEGWRFEAYAPASSFHSQTYRPSPLAHRQVLIAHCLRLESMKLNGHQIGLLKSYMSDLVEQARQDDQTGQAFGFAPTSYRPDQAVSDLLAILDDRVESEGVQVGLPSDFLHQMWMMCNEAQPHLRDQLWLESGLEGGDTSKAAVRRQTYRALLTYLEEQG